MVLPEKKDGARFSRRGFVMAGAGLIGLASQIRAVNKPATPWSVVVVPDPQYMAATEVCPNQPTSYDNLMRWIVENRNLSVDGVPLAIKAAIGVGDCVNSADSVYTGEAPIAASAWSRLDAAGIHKHVVPGNHDWVSGAGFGFSRDDAHLDALWTGGNPFSAKALASGLGSGMKLAGSNDHAYWGGSYGASGANTYTTMEIGDRRILVIGLEFFPRSEVLNWAKRVHDAHPFHECWITTHSYLSDQASTSANPDSPNNRATRGAGTLNNCWGPDAYIMGAAPASNSGDEMWNGSDESWEGLKSFTNLTAIFSGHWIDPANDGGWYWQSNFPQSSSLRGQGVLEVFANWQQLDSVTHCGGDPPNSDSGHLVILRFREDLAPRTVEAFALSTNSGKWYGAKGIVPSVGPVQLFNLNFPGVPLTEGARRGLVTRG